MKMPSKNFIHGSTKSHCPGLKGISLVTLAMEVRCAIAVSNSRPPSFFLEYFNCLRCIINTVGVVNDPISCLLITTHVRSTNYARKLPNERI